MSDASDSSGPQGQPVDSAVPTVSESTEPLDRKAAYAQRRAAMRAKSEAKNEAVRRSLEPLGPGERPGAITAAATVATLSALAFWASARIAAFGDATIAGVRQPNPLMMVVIAVLITWLAIGLWRVSYGATLAFQGFIVLVILTCSLGLIVATSWIQAISCLLIVAGGSYLFYKLVRAMARLQAPPPVDGDAGSSA